MDIQFLARQDGPQLAYERIEARSPGLPTVIFLGGFRSDMAGTKASFLSARAREAGWGFIRFDYGGHGRSAGRFADGTMESWRDDALSVIDRLSTGPVILVGSSMGGWIALLAALLRPDRVAGMVGIAAAPDFTRNMVEQRFDDVMRASYDARGYAEVPNDYSPEPYRITRGLIESGNRVCLLDRVHDVRIPMHLLQGLRDSEVPGDMPDRIAAAFPQAEIKIHLIGDGDHSLSRPEDLDLLAECIEDLIVRA